MQKTAFYFIFKDASLVSMFYVFTSLCFYE